MYHRPISIYKDTSPSDLQQLAAVKERGEEKEKKVIFVMSYLCPAVPLGKPSGNEGHGRRCPFYFIKFLPFVQSAGSSLENGKLRGRGIQGSSPQLEHCECVGGVSGKEGCYEIQIKTWKMVLISLLSLYIYNIYMYIYIFISHISLTAFSHGHRIHRSHHTTPVTSDRVKQSQVKSNQVFHYFFIFLPSV